MAATPIRRTFAEFTQHLAELGWAHGRNVRIDVRWGGSNVDLLHRRPEYFRMPLVTFQNQHVINLTSRLFNPRPQKKATQQLDRPRTLRLPAALGTTKPLSERTFRSLSG